MPNKESVKKRKLIGEVVSDRMTKTRVVAVSRQKKHRKYLKYFTVTTRFQAHDEKNEYHTGDRVVIEETKPQSRHKRWRIVGLNSKFEARNPKQIQDEKS